MVLCRNLSVTDPKYFKKINLNNELPETCMEFLSGQLLKYRYNWKKTTLTSMGGI